MSDDVTLRPFEPGDRDACYRICLQTADNGGDATALHNDPRIVGEVWVGPYLERWPQCAFVLEDELGVGGYVVGAPDTVAHDRWVDDIWMPPLRRRYPVGTFAEGSADEACVALIHAPPVMPPEIVASHPAHLHIDMVPRLQGRGLGRALMEALFDALRANGAAAVHLGCSPDNTKAIAFYRHLGFDDLMGGFLWGRSTSW